MKTYKEDIIHNEFKNTELILYNSIQVLLQFYIKTKIPTFLNNSYDSPSSH